MYLHQHQFEYEAQNLEDMAKGQGWYLGSLDYWSGLLAADDSIDDPS